MCVSSELQEERYDFDVHEGKETFFGTIAVISADDPASNSLGGFKESVAAYRFCQQCKANSEETKAMVRSLLSYLMLLFTYVSSMKSSMKAPFFYVKENLTCESVKNLIILSRTGGKHQKNLELITALFCLSYSTSM